MRLPKSSLRFTGLYRFGQWDFRIHCFPRLNGTGAPHPNHTQKPAPEQLGQEPVCNEATTLLHLSKPQWQPKSRLLTIRNFLESTKTSDWLGLPN